VPPSTPTGTSPTPCRYTRLQNYPASGLRPSRARHRSRVYHLPGELAAVSAIQMQKAVAHPEAGRTTGTSAALRQVRIGRIVADQARPGVLPERPATARAKANWMRIRSTTGAGRKAAARASHIARRVTGHAVSLGVAADTDVQVPLGLPSVVARRARPLCPYGRRWMKAAAFSEVFERSAPRDPHPLVARQAERLLLMATRAARSVLPSRDRVHR
jgi:hypothetical protein